jgi:cytidyltransferase-like protein
MQMTEGPSKLSPYTGVGQYLPTSRRIVQFSEGREPKPTDRIVYIDGTFDLFHIGHVEILKAAKALGDFLIVGILPDDVVNQKKGFGWPVMNLHERVLSVLSCRYVDEVIIGAPWAITEELIKVQRISIVARGTVSDPAYKVTSDEYDHAFETPRSLGILRNITSPTKLTTSDIVQRIIDNRKKFVERNLKKEAKEVQELQKSGEFSPQTPQEHKPEEKTQEHKTEEKSHKHKTEEKSHEHKTEEKPQEHKPEAKPQEHKTEEKPQEHKPPEHKPAEKPQEHKTEEKPQEHKPPPSGL